MSIELINVPDGIEAKLDYAANLWADANEQDSRQWLLDHWVVQLILEELKERGLVDGECGSNPNDIRLLVGYFVGKGLVPKWPRDGAKENLLEHIALEMRQ